MLNRAVKDLTPPTIEKENVEVNAMYLASKIYIYIYIKIDSFHRGRKPDAPEDLPSYHKMTRPIMSL